MTQEHAFQNDLPMFVTTNTKSRRPVFANPAYASEAIDLLYRLQGLHPFFIFGFVIMPDHCHFLVNVPAPYGISKLMNAYKTGLTFDLGIGPFWQPRFHVISPDNCGETLRYIHQNPVRAGLASSPEAYPWSSASGKYDITQLD